MNDRGEGRPALPPGPLWVALTTLLGLGLALALYTVSSLVGLRILELRLGGPAVVDGRIAPEVFADLGSMVLVILPSQVALALLAVALAFASPRGPGQALGLGPPRARASELALVALAMPAAMLLGGLLVHAIHESPTSATLDEIRRLIDAPRSGPELLAIGAMLCLVPALAEELFFRGWMQRRLARVLGPAAAIGLSSLAFAAMHMDPVQATGVLPAGLLLGYLAWRTRSLWTAVLGHAAFNALGVVLARLPPELLEEAATSGEIGPGLAFLLAFVLSSPLALIVLVVQLERRARRAAREAAAE